MGWRVPCASLHHCILSSSSGWLGLGNHLKCWPPSPNLTLTSPVPHFWDQLLSPWSAPRPPPSYAAMFNQVHWGVLPAAGSDVVDWLYHHVEGFTDRRESRKYASNLLKAGYIRHTVNKITFSEQCYYIFGDLCGSMAGSSGGGLREGARGESSALLCPTSSLSTSSLLPG